MAARTQIPNGIDHLLCYIWFQKAARGVAGGVGTYGAMEAISASDITTNMKPEKVQM